jgi:hypothetical protein
MKRGEGREEGEEGRGVRGDKVEKEVEEGSRMSLRKMIEMIMRK